MKDKLRHDPYAHLRDVLERLPARLRRSGVTG